MPGRSGFNMSHNNFFSAPVGTLVPSMIDFLIPGDEVDLSSKLHVQLPPMATDFYGRIEAKEEAFFVPARILFGGWKDFYVNPVDGTTNPSNIDGQLAKYLIGALIENSSPLTVNTIRKDGSRTEESCSAAMAAILSDIIASFSSETLSPLFTIRDVELNDIGAGSLCDYLGFKVDFKNLKFEDVRTALTKFEFPFDSSEVWSIFSTADSKRYVAITRVDDDYVYTSYSNTDFLAVLQESRTDVLVVTLTSGIYWDFTFYPYSANYSSITSEIRIPNILPLMAYHKIYDDWYRAPMIQQSLFKRNVANQSTATSVANMPWITSGAQDKIYFQNDQLNFANGHSLFDLHQRNWQKDYFTSATPEPQAGDASSVKFDIVDESGEFTIASLRAANALQQWLDRNNIGGFRYGDMIYAQYGVYPSDAITDRAIYLGSTSVDVYNKSIYQQSGDGGTDTNNPFNAIGSKYSNPTGVGDGNFCNNYRVTEAGFVIKIFSLVPQAYYSTGVRRMFMYNDISDIAFPVLAGVGDQEIKGYELTDAYNDSGDNTTFGFIQRYAEYKFIDDQVHGLLRDGQSLDSFALQRSFNEVPELGTDFLEIPRDYLDQVSATSYKLSQYGCWVNCYNDYRKSSTLPAYSIPTLEDLKGRTELVDKGGSYLA